MATELENLVVRISADTQDIRTQLQRAQRATTDYSASSVKSLQRIQQTVVGLAGSLGLGMLIKSTADAAVQFQKFESGLRAATGSAGQAKRELEFVRSEAKRLGIDVVSAAESFTKLAASARGTALAGAEARNIFSAVSEASRVLGLSAEQTGGALTAIEQMISKGKVSAEELRGQLGERLPGAFQIAARAIGVTTQELDKMLSDGKLLAEDFLPAFAKEVTKTFATELPNAVNLAQAEFARFNNAMFDLKTTVGMELLPTLSRMAKFFADEYIPAVVWAAREIGILDRNLRSMGEGQLRLRFDDAGVDLERLFQQSSRTAPGSEARANIEKQIQALVAERMEIAELLKAYDARNERIVKSGIDAVRAGEAAEGAAKKTAAAVAEVSKEYVKERDKLLERLATLDDNTEAARVLFEVTKGGLKDIAPAQKAELKLLAERLDLEEDTMEVREFMRDQARDRQREWEQERKRQHEAQVRETERTAQERLRTAERAAQREAEILAEPFKTASNNIQNTFSTMFENLFRGSIDSWKDFASSIKGIFLRLASEIATLLIFRPVFAGVLGGAAAGASAAGAAGSTGSVLSALTGGAGGGGALSMIPALTGGLRSPLLGHFGGKAAAALGLAQGGFGTNALVGAGMNAPFGILGSLGANLLGLGGGVGGAIGGTAGGLLGGGLGSALFTGSSIAGPIGAVAGGLLGTVFGGLFGGKPSRKTQIGRLNNRGGTLSTTSLVGDQDGTIGRISEAISQAVNAELAQRGLVLKGRSNLQIREVVNADKVGDNRFQAFASNFIPGVKAGNNALNIESNDPQQFAQQVVQAILQNAVTKPSKESLDATREQTKAARDQARAFLRSLNPLNQFSEAARSLIAQLRDLRANASQLGLSMREILRASQAAIGGQIQNLIQQRRGVLGIPALESLQQNLSFGELSAGTSMQRFNRANAELERVAGAAMRGNVGAVQDFPGLAQEVLGLGRDVFASGPQYGRLFTSVNSTLNQVLSQQRNIESSLLAGLDISIRETAQDQIIALNKGIQVLATELRDIKARLRAA